MIDEMLISRDWRREVEQRGGSQFVFTKPSYAKIGGDLAREGVEVRPYTIDVEQLHRYVDDCGYRQLPYWEHYGKFALKKCLEHFISIDLTCPVPGEVVIDVASCQSPFPGFLARHWGVQAYRQDYIYAPRLEDDRIGGDATAMPLPDGFADILTLHCSFEHFEGDRDIGFLKEAYRILKPGGRLCIVPLYTCHRYAIQTDPDTWRQSPVSFESDAMIYLVEGWGESHARFYDTAHFLDRIVANLNGFELVLYSIENSKDVAPIFKVYLAALLTKPKEDKADSQPGIRSRDRSSQFVDENAELRHLLEENRVETQVQRCKVQQLGTVVDQMEQANHQARELFEGESAKLLGVIEKLVEDCSNRDDRLDKLQIDLDQAHRAHDKAAGDYKKEIARLLKVIEDLRIRK